jgi:type IV pilus assembly protein PilO
VNALLERVLELPPRQRVLALVGAVAAVFFLYAYLLYSPRESLISQKQEARDALRQDRDRKAALVANIEQTRRLVAELDGDLRKAVAELPDTKEIPDLLSSISSHGIESGLEIIQFKQRPEQYEEFYAIVPVEIVVRGTYHQVAAFFDRVGRMARIVNVSDVSMKAPTRVEGGEVALNTSCSAVTFRFLDEEERARIAKQKEKEQNKGKGGR